MNLLLLNLGESVQKAPPLITPSKTRKEAEEGLLVLTGVLRALGASIRPAARFTLRVLAALAPFIALGLFLLL